MRNLSCVNFQTKKLTLSIHSPKSFFIKNIFQFFAPPPPRRPLGLFKFYSSRSLALLFALALLPNLVFAQFFTEYQSNQFQWPSGGLTRYQKLQDTTFSKSVKIVSTEDVRTAQSNELLSFQLPGDTSTLTVEASLISEDPTSAFIWSGKITSAPGGYVTFTSFITEPTSSLPGVAPYTVYWFWNTSGIFGSSQQLLGTGDTLTLLAHPECPVYWVKCVVVSDDNVVVSRIQKITMAQVPCSCNEEERPARGRGLQKSTSQAPLFSIFPNPVAQGTLFVQTNEFLSLETVAYKITDVGGREISSGFLETFHGAALGVPVAALANGLYFLNLLLPEGAQEIHKFIIAKTH